ncbi:hypothetical protein ANN_09403 [Periplaneta americana]|uniref:Uncharacterized protein n=1 Tax=Periplaneta americana TaxID=6978 RepID=A0ABQ8TMZ9_PERAM|nr:hypothetical protein ANN_09403 [Periplaneta americana]
MDTTPRKRSKIITLAEHSSMTQREIAAECHIGLATVNSIIKRYRETGSITPQKKGNCGRKGKTSPADDRLIVRKSKLNPRLTAVDLTRELMATTGANIHVATVRRRLLKLDEGLLSPKRLKISEASIIPRTTGRNLRDELRKRSFESWCQLLHKGKGVVIYEEYPRANSRVSTKENLSSSEYINAIKMFCNLIAVRSVPGRAFSTTHCRQPDCNETETLGQVLGFSRKGKSLRNNRHPRVRRTIACLLRNKGWEVHEQVHCISEDDSHRRADIIAINRQQQKAIIIDLPIRMERYLNQAHQVDHEKRAIYESCIPYLSAKYNIPFFNLSVTGLFFGARRDLLRLLYLRESNPGFAARRANRYSTGVDYYSHSLESNYVPFVFVSNLRVAYRRNVSLETMYLYKNETRRGNFTQNKKERISNAGSGGVGGNRIIKGNEQRSQIQLGRGK